MPRHPCRGGSGPLIAPRHLEVQLLWHQIDIAADPDLVEVFEPLIHRAAQPVMPIVTTRFGCRREADELVVSENGDELLRTEDPRSVRLAVFERAQRRMFELATLKGWLRIHGAVLNLGDRRVALVGRSGSGKTTLALAALAAGHLVEADESFLTDGHRSLAVPRRFHCEAGTLDLVPQARAWAERSPMLDHHRPVWAIDPGSMTGHWEVRCATLDALVLLTDVEGPGVRRIRTPEALPAMLRQALPTVESRAAVLARLAPLLGSTPLVALDGGHAVSPEERLSLVQHATLV